MEIILCLSLLANIVLLVIVFRMKKSKDVLEVKSVSESSIQSVENEKTSQITETCIKNNELHELAKRCEAELPVEHRGLVKILIEKEFPDLPAALQIGDVKISIKRDNKNVSLFDVVSPRDVLNIARDGYNFTGRYVPVPCELETVLRNADVINVYFRALGLEEISCENDFWCACTETGWRTGWKRFDWSVDVALEKLGDKILVRRANAIFRNTPPKGVAKLFVLLKGWEHLFVEA